jgi:ABC-2 type transport system ATP-binding protein
MEATIEVTGLRELFEPAVARDGLSFTVTPGSVTGFVSPKAAGRPAIMRVAQGLDAADESRTLTGGRPYRSLQNPVREAGSSLPTGLCAPAVTAQATKPEAWHEPDV